MSVSTSSAAPFDRAAHVARLETEQFDVLVVGGGITGAGVALDAASRGLRVALVERDDYASGTSSKSSKLIHGGLRYLQQGEIRLVYEALHERQRLCRNAPYLVQMLPFMIPVLTKDGVISKRIARALGSALWMYDLTGGWRIGRFHRRLKADQALAHLPTMPRDGLSSAYLYFDATADDARLCLTVARTAARHGATVVNRAAVRSLTSDAAGTVTGAQVHVDGRTVTVAARCVVSATGVWADQVRAMDPSVSATAPTIRPAKGIHITLPWSLVRNDIAVVIPVPQDKRSLFVIPIGAKPDGTFEHTYIGTTDTDYTGSLDDPTCTGDDVAYVLRALNAAIASEITADQLTGSWAGLRPLVASTGGRTADLSRRHRVTVSPSGVVSISGGKLTTYREMAEDTVDEVVRRLHPGDRLAVVRHRSRTKRLPLVGTDGYTKPDAGSPRLHLARRYGALAGEVEALVSGDPSLGQPLVPGLAYLRAEAIYAARHEQATTLDDVLSRRTRARLFDRHATAHAAPEVAALLAGELGWDAARQADEVAAFQASCTSEDSAAAAPRATA